MFRSLPLDGAWLITPKRNLDERGYFDQLYCKKEFAQHGLVSEFTSVGVSHNNVRGTVRGLHFQRPPVEQAKLIRVTHGAIKDVIIDLRPNSPTFMQHVLLALRDQEWTMLYVPPGFGHGFQTLTDQTKVEYHIAGEYVPELADGYRWDDPAFDIWMPLPVTMISERDRTYPDFDLTLHKQRFST